MPESTGNETVSDITRAHSTPLSVSAIPDVEPDEADEEDYDDDEG